MPECICPHHLFHVSPLMFISTPYGPVNVTGYRPGQEYVLGAQHADTLELLLPVMMSEAEQAVLDREWAEEGEFTFQAIISREQFDRLMQFLGKYAEQFAQAHPERIIR